MPIDLVRLLPQCPVTGDHFSPGQIGDSFTHPVRHEWLERLILGRQDKQDWLANGQILGHLLGILLPTAEEITPLVHEVVLAISIPVQGAIESVPRVLVDVVVHLLVGEELVPAKACHLVEVDAALGVESDFLVRRARSVHVVQEPADLGLGLHGGLDLAGREMQLVAEVGEAGLDQEAEGFVFRSWREVRRADAEDGGDEGWVVLRHAVDDGAAPVVAAEDDAREAELLGERGDVVGHTLVGVGFQRVARGVGSAVAHAVDGYDVEAERGQEWDLIAPAHGQVRKAVHEEDGAAVGGGGGGTVDVAVRVAVEVCGAESDAWVVVWFDFVDGHGESWDPAVVGLFLAGGDLEGRKMTSGLVRVAVLSS